LTGFGAIWNKNWQPVGANIIDCTSILEFLAAFKKNQHAIESVNTLLSVILVSVCNILLTFGIFSKICILFKAANQTQREAQIQENQPQLVHFS